MFVLFYYYGIEYGILTKILALWCAMAEAGHAKVGKYRPTPTTPPIQ